MHRGYVKIWRKFLEWEWFGDVNTQSIFLMLLLTCNFDDKNWRGIVIKRGEIVAGIKTLGKKLHLTHQQTRTSLDKLKSTNDITIKTTNKYSIISITNYDSYQDNNKQNNKRVTIKQQSNNNQITTTKEYKNVRIKELEEEDKKYCDKSLKNSGLQKIEKITEGAVTQIQSAFEGKTKTKTVYQKFYDAFAVLYANATRGTYNSTAKDFVFLTDLIKKHGEQMVADKIYRLLEICKIGDKWYARGLDDFTIPKLHQAWNHLVDDVVDSERSLARMRRLFPNAPDEKRKFIGNEEGDVAPCTIEQESEEEGAEEQQNG